MELQLTEFLQGQIFMVALVFARIGTSLLFMPGLGESYIPTRVKVLFAVSLSIVLASFFFRYQQQCQMQCLLLSVWLLLKQL